MIVRELFALFGYKVDARSQASVEQSLSRTINGVKMVAEAFIAGAVANKIRELVTGVAEAGHQAEIMAQRVGISTQALQGLQYAAQVSGVDAGELAVGMRTLARNAYEAGRGNNQASQAFARLGINLRDANGQLLPADRLFASAADKLAGVSSATERAALAQLIFGRSGAALVPMLAGGSAGLAAMRQEAEDLGIVMDKSLIEESKEYERSQARLKGTLQGLRNLIASKLLPGMTQTTKAILAWYKANRELIRQKITDFLREAVRFLASVKDGVMDIVSGIREWWSGLDAGGQKFLEIVGIVVGLATVLAMPFGWLLLIGAAVAGIIDDFEVWKKGGKSLIGALLGPFDTFVERHQVLYDTLQAIKMIYEDVFNAIVKFENLGLSVGSAIWHGAGNLLEAIAPPSAANQFGGSQIQQQNHVEIKIEAGNQNPEAIGAAAAKHAKLMLDDQMRSARNAFTVTAP